MSKTKWPRECPVFEVVDTKYETALLVGDIVEGWLWAGYWPPEFGSDYGVEVRVYSPRWNCTFGLEGWGCGGPCGDRATLKPLTPTARAMLAIAKAHR